jgi:hypothetical protein
MAGLPSSPGKPSSVTVLSMGTLAVFVAWLAVACYALAYFIAR